MKVLGIDSSTTCTGWAIFDTKKDKLLSYGKITPDKKMDYTVRIFEMAKHIYDIIDKNNIKYLKYEEAFSRSRNVKKQENLIGMIIFVCFELGVAFEAIHPSKINKLWGIPTKKKERPKSKKELTIDAVNFVFNAGLGKKDDDIADAISFSFVETDSQKAYEESLK